MLVAANKTKPDAHRDARRVREESYRNGTELAEMCVRRRTRRKARYLREMKKGGRIYNPVTIDYRLGENRA